MFCFQVLGATVRFLHVFSLSFASVSSFNHDIPVFRCIIFQPSVFRFRVVRLRCLFNDIFAHYENDRNIKVFKYYEIWS